MKNKQRKHAAQNGVYKLNLITHAGRQAGRRMMIRQECNRHDVRYGNSEFGRRRGCNHERALSHLLNLKHVEIFEPGFVLPIHVEALRPITLLGVERVNNDCGIGCIKLIGLLG